MSLRKAMEFLTEVIFEAVLIDSRILMFKEKYGKLMKNIATRDSKYNYNDAGRALVFIKDYMPCAKHNHNKGTCIAGNIILIL